MCKNWTWKDNPYNTNHLDVSKIDLHLFKYYNIVLFIFKKKKYQLFYAIYKYDKLNNVYCWHFFDYSNFPIFKSNFLKVCPIFVDSALCVLEIKPCGLKFKNSRCLFLELQNNIKSEKLNFWYIATICLFGVAAATK